MSLPTDEQLWAHALGLLEPGEALAVGASVAADPALAGLVAAHRSMGARVGAAGNAGLTVVEDPTLSGDGTSSVTATVPHRPGWRPVVLHHGDVGVVVLHPTSPGRFVPLDVFPGGAERSLALELPVDGVVQILLVPPDMDFQAPGPGAWGEARDRVLGGEWPAWWLGRGVG